MSSSLRETHLRATERHLSCEITQRYLPPDTGRPVLDLPTPDGCKAELTLVAGYIPR